MQFRIPRFWLITIFVAMASTLSVATPSLVVNPSSIATDETGHVQVSVGSLLGAQPGVVLRLYADANGNGTIDAEDYAVWTDVIEDGVTEWSPSMFSDTDLDAGEVIVDLRLFGPLQFPYTAGSFIWEAEDGSDGSKQTSSFTVTQAAQTQSVSGQVLDSATPVPGALVVLEAVCEGAEDSMRSFSALADASGNYTIAVPGALDCHHRVLLAARPGYVGSFVGQPYLVFSGTDNFTNQDLQLEAGTRSVTGRVVFDDGPRVGEGVPGVSMWVESDDDDLLTSIAFTDEDGNYGLLLSDGPWLLETPEGIDSRGAVELEGEIAFDATVTPVILPNMDLIAASAFFEGTLYDDVGVPQAGRWVSARRSWPCDPDCYESETLTRSDGTYSVGVFTPPAGSHDYRLEVPDPLPGLVARSLGCQTINDGITLGGKNLQHVTPTGFVTGTMRDSTRQPLGNTCMQAWAAAPGCDGYSSAAVSTCGGSYSLPVVDAQWNVRIEPEDTAVLYRDLDDTAIDRQLTVSGSQAGVDFLIGRSRYAPTVTYVEPLEAPAGSHVMIEGHGFSLGSAPQVFFDGSPATIISFRPDMRRILVEVPALAAGDRAITVRNPDLDKTSDPSCFSVTSGGFVPACTISGKAIDSNTLADVPGATVLVFADAGETLVRAGVTDINGDYATGLDAAGDYAVLFVAPEGSPYGWGSYGVVTCGTTRNHGFDTGWQVTGHISTDTGDNFAGAIIDAEETNTGASYMTVTDEDGNFTLIVDSGDYEIYFEPWPGSRFAEPAGVQPTITSNTVLTPVVLNRGFFFSGTIVDLDRDGVAAEVEAFRRSDGGFGGFADSNACTGQFNAVVPAGEYRLDILPEQLDTDGPTQVKWIDVTGDTLSEFDFVVSDRTALQGAGPAPRINFFEPGATAQVGQPIQVFVANLGGATVDVLFSDGVGGFLSGSGTVWDTARGFVVTRVPSGAATGAVKVRVDGQDSAPVPFAVDAGIFPGGSHSVSGTVSGGAVDGTFVGLFWVDPANPDCDDFDGTLVDYGMAGVTGAYGPLIHPGGDFSMAFLPPATAGLAPAGDERLGVFTNTTVDAVLPTGFAVHLRAIDDEAVPGPLPNVELVAEGAVSEDWRVTDANGDATLYLAAGDYDFELIPYTGTRVLEQEWSETISGTREYGDTAMASGIMLGGAIMRESDGSGVGSALAEAQRDTDPWGLFFESTSGADGVFRGPVESGSSFQLSVEAPSDALANHLEQGLAMGTNDLIMYPAIELGPAGFVEGVIRDAVTLLPLEQINVSGNEDDGGAFGDFAGWSRTCPDGSYRMKLPVGDHFVSFNDFDFNTYFGRWHPDAYCFDEATSLTVTAGGTTTADIDLVEAGSISGTVLLNGSPLQDAGVCATSVALGGCLFCAFDNTDAFGNYTLDAPPATDFQVDAFASGLGNECYDSFDGCANFTPVVVVSGADTSSIDFDLGCDDADSDGHCDPDDNCPFTSNPVQANGDGDLFGDLCDPCEFDVGNDADGDGVCIADGDCNDNDINNFPGNAEICDGVDNDCNGMDDAGNPGIGGQESDNDFDGVSICAGDCNDADGANYPGNTEVCDGADNDCDGSTDNGLSTDADLDGHYTPASCFTPNDDCDDADAASYPGNPEICDGADNDCDGSTDNGLSTDADLDGHYTPASCFTPNDDCDDADATSYPGNPEACDGVDNDCDGSTDNGLSTDADLDGHYTPGSCFTPNDDCDDADAASYPGNPEICDGADNDCDGSTDNGLSTDADLDGHYTPASCFTPNDDCDDADATSYPGNPEACDGVDNDCDGSTDNGLSTDADLDGHYTPGSCFTPADDCDDGNAASYPGNAETCDGQDNNCDGSVDEGLSTDTDGDGHFTPGSCFTPNDDCDDGNANNYPGNTEVCDGQDNNCAGGADEGLNADADFDLVTICGGDCDDADPFNFPGNTEFCDGQDNNCDASIDEGFDVDLDGVTTCGGDCDDSNGSNFPGNVEVCDGQDNNCNASTDEGLSTDVDTDGHYTPGSCFTPADDCDDADATNYPGNLEVCDGQDNTCDGSIDEGFDIDLDGVTTCGGDCDDTDGANFPGNAETCDAQDNNCDGSADEGLSTDLDVDGHYALGSCFTPADDCDDSDAANYPGNTEACDGQDNTCDGSIDEGFDIDLDGVTTCGGDCDDTDGANFPGNVETCDAQDNNCDGSIDEGLSTDVDVDGHYAIGSCFTPADDCDDSDAANYPGNTEVCDGQDNTCDGSVDEGFDIDLDGVTTCGGDCNDTDAANFPGNAETCDAQDNNCDGSIDEGLSTDADLDGHYTIGSCFTPADDCDDADAVNYPGNTEVCDGQDNTCDGSIDEGFDIDLDGVTTCGGDCDDGDAANYPGNTEACDAQDNNCDGAVDEGLSTDVDLDGHYVPGSCLTPADDCDDANAANYPGNTEVCDGQDNTCDGSVDEGLSTDVDLDGHYTAASCFTPNDDCDDTDAANYPGNTEVCDGQDNTCDGAVDEGLSTDVDSDGHYTAGSCLTPADDCDDSDAANYPGNTEVCDGQDNTCDGSVDEGLSTDADSDGHYTPSSCFTPADDCDDSNAGNNPAATEVCDGQDNDCDGTVDDGFDMDADGVTDCTDNCMTDANPTQDDYDLDGRGDVCETGVLMADIDLSSRVDGFDLARMARAFGSGCGDSNYEADSDLNRDCLIDGNDLALFAGQFGQSSQ